LARDELEEGTPEEELEATEDDELAEEEMGEDELEEPGSELEEKSEFAGVEQLTRNKKERAKQNVEARQKDFRPFFIAFYYRGRKEQSLVKIILRSRASASKEASCSLGDRP